MTCQFWVQWWRFWRQWVTVVFDDVSIHQYGQIIIYHHCIWYGRWRANFGCSGDAFGGNGLLFFLMMCLYITMVRSSKSYIIIVSGKGDDVPISGAVVTLLEALVYCCFWWYIYLEAMGNCCFWWCFLYITMVRSSYIIIVSGMGDDVPTLGAVVTLLEAIVYWCFDDVSIHHYGQIIIYLVILSRWSSD